MATTSAIQSGIRHKIRTVASKLRPSGSSSASANPTDGAEGYGGLTAEGEAPVRYDDHNFPELYDFEEDRLHARGAPTGRSTSAGASGTTTANASSTAVGSTPSQSSMAAGEGREGLAMVGHPFSAPPKFKSSDMHKSKLSSFFKSADATLHPTTHRRDPAHEPAPQGEVRERPTRANPAAAYGLLESLPVFAHGAAGERGGEGVEQGEVAGGKAGGKAAHYAQSDRPTTLANCSVPLRLDVQGEVVEVDTQVQIYATNAQLCHPLVSPALGYMGGLCPLFIMCGDNEVLRDEIIYL